MAKKHFAQYYYLTRFKACGNNCYLDDKINDYISKVLYCTDDSYIDYLKLLENDFSYPNYMYILESIINYIIKIHKLTYFDYMHNKNIYSYETLCNVERRYKNLYSLYSSSLAKRYENNIETTQYKKTRKY